VVDAQPAEQRHDVVFDPAAVGPQAGRLLVRDAFGQIKIAERGERHGSCFDLAGSGGIIA
jgi:hypothetical protein